MNVFPLYLLMQSSKQKDKPSFPPVSQCNYVLCERPLDFSIQKNNHELHEFTLVQTTDYTDLTDYKRSQFVQFVVLYYSV